MKESSQLVHVGKVMDAHGIRGDIYCLIFSGDNSWIDKLQQITLTSGDQKQEHEILQIKKFKKGFIAKLKGLENRNQAEELKGFELWVNEDIFVSKNGESLYLREVLGFQLIDEKLGAVGVVSAFSSNGLQDLLVVQSMRHTYEIPFVKEFVIQIDFKNKKINTVLPEGLLEINEDED